MSRSTLSPGLFGDNGSSFVIGPTRAWRNQGPNKLVLFCHGSGGTTLSTLMDKQKQLILDFGVDTVCILSNWVGENWGNDDSVNMMAAGIAYARANLGCSGKVGLVGASMGNLTAMNYARAHPTDVAAIASIIPAIDIQEIYTDLPSYDANINAAYPPGWSDVTFRAHNPIHMAQDTLLDDTLPIKIWSLSTDTIALPSLQYSFVSYRPQTEIVSFTSPGMVHGDAAVEYVRPDVVAWMKGKLL